MVRFVESDSRGKGSEPVDRVCFIIYEQNNMIEIYLEFIDKRKPKTIMTKLSVDTQL